MKQNQQVNQGGQAGGTPYQSGQMEPQAGQASQDNRYSGGAMGQNTSGQGQQGQQGGSQASQSRDQGREVSTAAQGSELSRSRQPSTTLLPPVDIYEDDSGFTVMADLPGVAKEQLVVRVTGDNLLIEGSASVPVSGNMELVYGEVHSPHYRRNFTLSRELDPGKIEANLSNGVLRLRIPKAEEAKPRRIEVKVG